MGDILRFNRNYEDGSDFEPSGSEDDYSENEKMLLEKVRAGNKRHFDDSDEEVLGIHSSAGSEDDGDVNDMASDLDGQGEEDGLPDSKAWGKKRKTFHHTDYVDEDFGGFQGKDAEAAELEEQEARAIQERLVQQLDEQDFSLDIFSKPVAAAKEDETSEVIKTDLTKLSKRQKLALLEKESPEFLNLVEDFKVKMMEIKDRLQPMMKLIKEDKLPKSLATDFVKTKYHLILNYCVNIVFYVLLKAQRISIQSHPVVRRLFQYRQLMKQLEPSDEVMTPQIDRILELVNAGEELLIVPEQLKQNTRVTKKVKKMKKKEEVEEVPALPSEELDDDDDEEEDDDVGDDYHTVEEQNTENVADLTGESMEVEEEGVGKRAITYQIAKNKGLTPRRKKEQRNPRVKHRNKYHKAVVRRKGQVRQPRKEIRKYGGEISGIKIGVSKSIKIK